MACNKCNEEHRETAKFCDNCGTRLEKNRMNLKTIIALAVCLSAFIIVMTVVIRKANSKLKPCRSEEKNSLTEPSGKVFLTSLVKHQNRIISGLGMKLIYVAPGTFQMGSNDGESDEKPVHEVTISKGFWIGKYELTQREYQLIT
ncbi:MAG: SUMF1/EgtB/PvdO family nonheme iron enzyme, partial [Victivallaceae bacterium]|nr:SUMF1/EgtB/PvdO family nonheme iron enzyme [Victivallaceae bacterium]